MSCVHIQRAIAHEGKVSDSADYLMLLLAREGQKV